MRGSQEAEPPLVSGLVERMQSYNVDGYMCKGCRAWRSLDETKAEGWWILATDDLYCRACAEALDPEATRAPSVA